MATLPMATDTPLMVMLTMATVTARGLLMLSLNIITMAMDTLPMDTDMATTMARGLLMLSLNIITMAMDTLPMDMAMVMDTIALALASRFILNIPLKSSD